MYRYALTALLIAVAALSAGAAQKSRTQKVKVTGVLRDAKGQPISRVTLILEPTGGSTGSAPIRAAADDQGRFEVALAPGEYTMKTHPQLCGIAPVPLVARESASNEFELALVRKPEEPGGVISKVLQPTQLTFGFSQTKGLYGEITLQPFAALPTDRKGLGGGHLIQSGFCDPRLLPEEKASPSETKR